MSGDLRIGVSGWRYGPWRGAFYPKGLVQRAELAYASRQLSTIEINGSFYSLQQPASWGQWFDETPDDFVFSVKGPRFITHMKRLRSIERQRCQERLEGRRIEAEARRELPQHRSELAAEPQHARGEEIGHRRLGLAELQHVGDVA